MTPDGQSTGSTGGIQVTTGELAGMLGATLEGPEDLLLDGVEALHAAGTSDLSFITSENYADRWAESSAGAALVSEGVTVPGHDASVRALLIVPDAELSMIDVLERLAPEVVPPPPGVDETSSVHPSVELGAGACIGPHVSIGANCVLGDGVVIEGGARIGNDVQVGEGTWIGLNAVVGDRVSIGARCRLHSLTCLGTDGFGFRPAPDGKGLRRVPHVGTVHLGDDVELGAGTCVDRGKFGVTSIGNGSKLDNLVQVAHNVRIGCHCVVAAQAGFAGSVTVGDWVQIGAQVGVADHVSIGDGARVGAKAGVMRDVPAGTSVLGTPADESRKILRQVSCLRKLPQFMAAQGSQERRGDDA
ncbi:MAG: UDP-3-O-(3-hydroxymyristoyl)glucosamine N-acyltransferase [Phycisphaerae bacterium]|nr:UDP-3-O-(3-hydroxymyristoyl)glucosamine N-acyltransferase [Phycisphaerae bacterium]